MVDMDRKLVASEEQYEVAYFANKHKISTERARNVLDRAGASRAKADALVESDRRAKGNDSP